MNTPRSALSLADLLAPFPVGDFLGRFWQRRHYHAAGSASLIDSLRDVLGGFEVAGLLSLRGEATALGYSGGLTDRREKVPPEQALALYEQGYTLYFTLSRTPALNDFAAAVARDAGISTLTAWCSIFASKTSGGLRPHFDNNENFTVQLAGEKVWTIWPQTVDNAAHCCRRDEPLIVPDSGMYIDTRARTAELGPGQDVVMSAGSVLYHPRGSWHATRASSESISLNICLEPMTWYDVFLGAAAARLVSSTAVRGTVPAVRTTQDLEELARKMASVVAPAQRALAEITPEDASDASLAAPGLRADVRAMANQCTARFTETSRLRKNSLAAFDVVRRPAETTVQITFFLGRMTRDVTLVAPPELAAACERLAGPEREVVLRKLAGDLAGEPELVVVARALCAVGALRPASGKR
jgi:hypothetical protein